MFVSIDVLGDPAKWMIRDKQTGKHIGKCIWADDKVQEVCVYVTDKNGLPIIISDQATKTFEVFWIHRGRPEIHMRGNMMCLVINRDIEILPISDHVIKREDEILLA